MNKPVLIKKYSGEYEAFDVNKLINSLRRSRADEDIIQDVARKVQEQIEEGITTKKIYQMAFKMLKGKSRVSASKYKPRQCRGLQTALHLFDLTFFVDHMLTRNRVILLHFQLVRRRTLVLVSRVEVASARCRIHSNFFTHR